MEIRQLTTDYERRIFAERAVHARATQGFGFKYKSAPQLKQALKRETVYGFFETENAHAEGMIAGFAMHDLASAAQSFPKPALSHLPPESVIEGGALWSLSRGAAGVARRIAPVIIGILQAKAVLLYPICRPIDLTTPHRELGFVDACEPILNKSAHTLEGGPIWMQPLILEGEKLQAYVRWGFDCLFRGDDGRQVFQVNIPRSGRPTLSSTDRVESTADRISIAAV